ncbi:MAG: hypothetical protein ACOYN3_05370 [Acidimicrobiia bacterium]
MRFVRGVAFGIVALGLVGSGLLAACTSTPNSSGGAAAKTAVAFTPLGAGKRSTQTRPEPFGQVLVTRAAVLEELGGEPIPEWLARFPFQSEAVLFVSGGEKPDPGYRIDVFAVQRSGSMLLVQARVAVADEGFQPQVITEPYQWLSVGRPDAEGITDVRVTLTR